MSGHHVGDLASSFVEMAKAYEELPKIKAELAEANRAFNHASDTIQRLELKLIDRNTTIDELHTKVREAEVARDDAELRFLEADEKLGHVAKALQTAGESVGLELRKPESVKPLEATQVEGPLPSLSGSTEKLPEPSVFQENISLESHTFEDHGGEMSQPIAPEPFSPESSPTNPVEVREEVGPTADVTSQSATVNPITESPYANDDLVEHGTSNAGQSDPLPTVASPIDGSTAGSTNANPSADASSPIDEIDAVSYTNEPQDKWTAAWSEWAVKMDRKHGRYNWPLRTAQA